MGTNADWVRAGRALSEDKEAVWQVGVRVGESANGQLSASGTPLDDSGFVDFVAAGTQLAGEYRCADCGYGAVVHNELPPCPMCGGAIWESLGPLAGRVVD
jgi:lipopolysaccharide biosynthesis regulator YciM